jgi:N-acetylglucosamine-6-phosphate deacetylase
MKPSESYIAREALVSGLEQGVKSTLDTATIAMNQLVQNSAQFEGLSASEVLRIASLALDKTLRDTMGQWFEDSKKYVKENY